MGEYAGHDVDLAVDFAGGTTFVNVAQIRDLSGPGLSRNAIDATHRDSANFWRYFIKGFKDAGEITFDLVMDQDLSSQGTAGFLGEWSDDGTSLPNWRITFPDGWTWTFRGLVSGQSMNAPLDDLLTADV